MKCNILKNKINFLQTLCIIDACLKQVHKIPTQVFNFSHILCYEQIDILFWINQKKPM